MSWSQAVGPAAVLRVLTECSQELRQHALDCEKISKGPTGESAGVRMRRVQLLYVIDNMLSVSVELIPHTFSYNVWGSFVWCLFLFRVALRMAIARLDLLALLLACACSHFCVVCVCAWELSRCTWAHSWDCSFTTVGRSADSYDVLACTAPAPACSESPAPSKLRRKQPAKAVRKAGQVPSLRLGQKCTKMWLCSLRRSARASAICSWTSAMMMCLLEGCVLL